jgi:hypothetical protein
MAGASSNLSSILPLPQAAVDLSFLQVMEGISSLQEIRELLRTQQRQLALVVRELEGLRNKGGSPQPLPKGFISVDDLSARKFVSIKQAAYLLNISEKSVRRAIDRGLLKASKGFRMKRIPVEEITRYQKLTV